MDDQVIKQLIDFRNERNWEKYHTVRNLTTSVNLEAAEMMEYFQWKDELTEEEIPEFKEEIADTLIYLMYICEKLNLNPDEIMLEKIKKNKSRVWKNY